TRWPPGCPGGHPLFERFLTVRLCRSTSCRARRTLPITGHRGRITRVFAVSGRYWLRHSSHASCHTLQPSVGSSSGPPLLRTSNRSPRLLLFINQAAFSVERLMQPWLTLVRP